MVDHRDPLALLARVRGHDGRIVFTARVERAEKRMAYAVVRDVIEASQGLSEALSQIAAGVFSPDDVNRYKDMVQGLYDHDWFLVAADFDAYFAKQRHVDGALDVADVDLYTESVRVFGKGRKERV